MTSPAPVPAPVDGARPAPAALAALRDQIAREMALLELPQTPWLPPHAGPDGKPMENVVIVGGGYGGICTAIGLKLRGVDRVRVIDAAPEGMEGPWLTYARMRTLRSPKQLAGPEFGLPSLTYRAWHEASFGTESWNALDRIERRAWMDYVGWLRSVMEIPVENETRLVHVSEAPNGVQLDLETREGPGRITTSRLVLATGISGGGGFAVPEIIARLPRERWTHSGEVLDLSMLAGKRVGVIGGASSSFDWAVSVLREGPASVDMLVRQSELARKEILFWANFPGYMRNFAELPSLDRYRFTREMLRHRGLPTQETYDHVHRHPNFALHYDAAIARAEVAGDAIQVELKDGRNWQFDHLLLGTGYRTDISLRPELAGVWREVALWRDRFTPPEGEEDTGLLSAPYTGPSFELQEKTPGACPVLGRIHLFTISTMLSVGPLCNGVMGMRYGIPRLVSGLCRALFEADVPAFMQSLRDYPDEHLVTRPAGSQMAVPGLS